jgi:hypothetical protein
LASGCFGFTFAGAMAFAGAGAAASTLVGFFLAGFNSASAAAWRSALEAALDGVTVFAFFGGAAGAAALAAAVLLAGFAAGLAVA